MALELVTTIHDYRGLCLHSVLESTSTATINERFFPLMIPCFDEL